MEDNIDLLDVGLKCVDGGIPDHEGASLRLATHTESEFLNLYIFGGEKHSYYHFDNEWYICLSAEGAKKLRDSLNKIYPQ